VALVAMEMGLRSPEDMGYNLDRLSYYHLLRKNFSMQSKMGVTDTTTE